MVILIGIIASPKLHSQGVEFSSLLDLMTILRNLENKAKAKKEDYMIKILGFDRGGNKDCGWELGFVKLKDGKTYYPEKVEVDF